MVSFFFVTFFVFWFLKNFYSFHGNKGSHYWCFHQLQFFSPESAMFSVIAEEGKVLR